MLTPNPNECNSTLTSGTGVRRKSGKTKNCQNSKGNVRELTKSESQGILTGCLNIKVVQKEIKKVITLSNDRPIKICLSLHLSFVFHLYK